MACLSLKFEGERQVVRDARFGLMQMGAVVLASGSGMRAGLMREAGLVFEICAPDIDEGAVKAAARAGGVAVEEAALTLAVLKARAADVAGALVIGADQILVCQGTWFDKPVSIDAARGHLVALRGQVHELATAVVCVRDGVTVWRHVARPRLTMRWFSDAFLEAYLCLEGSRVLQSVGGYRLEGLGAQLFDHVEGEHAAVLGLPMLPLLRFLRESGTLRS